VTIPTGGAPSPPEPNADRHSSAVLPILPPRRTRIRDDLRRFLHDTGLSRRGFASILNGSPELQIKTNESAISRFLRPQATSSKVGDRVVLAIEAYLNKHVRPEWERGEAADPDPPSASLVEVARAFFGMGRHKVRQYHGSVPGIYRFYSYSESEKGSSAVCLGAIRLDSSFGAEELQTSITDSGRTIREEFQGYYIYRGDSLIAMLRNKNGSQPKFYILAISSYDTEDGQRESLSGLLIKTGVERPVFGAAIHMVRDDNAFEGTDVVSRASVDADILRKLDSRQWLHKIRRPPKASRARVKRS
jgi:hypothetical protein